MYNINSMNKCTYIEKMAREWPLILKVYIFRQNYIILEQRYLRGKKLDLEVRYKSYLNTWAQSECFNLNLQEITIIETITANELINKVMQLIQ